MNISIDKEKVFDKIQYPFIIKISTQKTRSKRNLTKPDKRHL